MSQNLYKIEFIGIPAQPIDTREYTTTMSNKLCAITSSILMSGGTIGAAAAHIETIYFDNIIMIPVTYTYTI